MLWDLGDNICGRWLPNFMSVAAVFWVGARSLAVDSTAPSDGHRTLMLLEEELIKGNRVRWMGTM